MNIEIITKADLVPIEGKLNQLLQAVHHPLTGLGAVYNTKELACKLKVSTKTINNWREARQIEFCKIQGVILFTEKAVTEFLANHSIKRKNSTFTSKSPSHE